MSRLLDLTTKGRSLLLVSLLIGTSLGLTGCYTKDGKWAPITYATEGCGAVEGCDRDNGSDSSDNSSGSSSSGGTTGS